MSESDVPAGQAGGHSTVSEAPELAERLRVHALAKLISATSRQVLDTLVELGAPAKGAQSSIDRETALRVIDALGATVTSSAEAEPPEPESAGAGPVLLAPSSPAPAAVPDFGAPATDAGPDGPGGALPLFAAPSPMFLPPEPPAPARSGRGAAGKSGPVDKPAGKPAEKASADSTAEDDEQPGADDADLSDGSDDGGETKRRRRRGRRGRGRGKGTDDESSDNGDGDDGNDDGSADTDAGADDSADRDAEDSQASDADADGADDDTSGEESGGASKRRRRRRRRKDSADSDSDRDARDVSDVDDPPNTVTRVREPRSRSEGDSSDNQIQGVRGSTRLEAKRQRRRDGRDAGRRRAPVLSEAEFLARRESVERTMVVRQRGERSEIGVLEDGVLVEHFVTSSGGSSLVGNVYLGRVQNVLPSMEAAFVDIGRGRNAVLYAGEVDWDAAGLAGKARRIEQALSSGDNVLVQVTKDPVGHKGARLTTQISLPGRFLVYVPSGGTHGISRKLPDVERRRLKDLLREIVPEDAGVIIRTASEGVSQEALERDVRRLQAQWEVVKTKADAATASSGKGSGRSKPPELLYEEPDLMIKVVRDQFNEDFAKLVVEGDDAWDTLHAYVGHVAPELSERLYRHVANTDVFVEYRIDEQITKAMDRKVWLPSGGTLVIDRTEAMTVIDVNTGKFTGSGGNLEETVTRNNLEAAEEIVRQLRLRDIGGIIVIDFIDMVLESNRDLVLRRLTECLGRDRTRHQVAEVTSLGLVQMTRKRVGVGLLEAFSAPCEHCRGRGVVVSSDPVEQRGDQGQHGSHSSGGRRRGRGGDHDGGQSGGQGGGNGGNNGRRRGGSSGGSGGEQQPAAEHGSPNGRAVPAPPADAIPAEPTPAEPAAVMVVPASPADSAREVVSPGTSEASAAEAAAAKATPVTSADPEAAAVSAAEQTGETTSGPAMSVSRARPLSAEPLDDQQVPAAGREPVPVGAPAAPAARPARRRRRVASRPAGPPAAEGEGPDPV